ncbi:hypothetical protein LR48_Vigan04g039100 [Vigna angularis]|uniref:SHSP domain-containing protein n=2 Tax=Phaseolus angularis TaxID=3914 RepID=A0A0L9UBP4_PHAAN|nr:inactive protein RESTRICTED TEV MOVEMENT 2 [Vigna angularis]KOM40193.1 hypothetical protein LR48_Vigan04g039100 [Vigna angularis]BAT79743.1 hypothetical protein VIGAN_02266900 [Vigna angularis var. angularis]
MSLDERTNPQAAAEPVHEDFIPPSDWDRQENSDTLILMLPGFRKEQLKVQVSSNRVLRLRGERKISDNKWRRFHKEVILSDSHDTTGINAKFEAGMLYVKLPKLIKLPPPPSPRPQEPSTPHRPTSPITYDDHKPDATQLHDHEKDSKEDTTHEESKIEEQPPPAHEISQVMLQKEMSKAETEDKREEMHETTQTTMKEQKEGHEDSEKKMAESQIKTDNDEKEMREVVASKAQGTGLEGLSRVSVAKMNTRLEKISDMVLEVKKQNKVANLVVLVFLVLLIGLYVKSVVKSSFAGPKNQDL